VELVEGFGVLVFRKQRLSKSVAVAGIVRVPGDGLLVGLLGVGIILGLRIGVTQKVGDIGRGGIAGCARQKLDCFLRTPLVDQELTELFQRRTAIGIVRKDLAKHLFCLGMLVLEAVQPREPQQRIGVVGVGLQDGLKLFGRLGQIFLLDFTCAHVAQRAYVDAC